ncbi:MAG TPA: tetratricopeptide repeat protein [Fimbriimonas sp.]|nr:tetratricopeptide repeat protein [Fimbriimonas sp.]
MKAIAALATLLLAVCASAQDAKRIAAIWSAAEDRIAQQTDVWFEDGEFPMVIQLLKVHNALDPHDYEVATNLGWMLENVEEWDDAIETYSRYQSLNPQDPDKALPLANYWFMKRKYEKIPPLLDTISDKAHPNSFRILAHAYERTKRLQDAESVWKRYLALHPNDATAKVNLTRVQKKIKESG